MAVKVEPVGATLSGEAMCFLLPRTILQVKSQSSLSRHDTTVGGCIYEGKVLDTVAHLDVTQPLIVVDTAFDMQSQQQIAMSALELNEHIDMCVHTCILHCRLCLALHLGASPEK